MLPSNNSPTSSLSSPPESTTSACSTQPSSVAGSDLDVDLSDLSLEDKGEEETLRVSEEAKAKAAEIKVEANAAFESALFLLLS